MGRSLTQCSLGGPGPRSGKKAWNKQSNATVIAKGMFAPAEPAKKLCTVSTGMSH
jgi:hypothetical protein